ncbi:MAG TPA: AMMECR1 domain-containing protein, partial [Candidatus Elarobacter sp.]|nr:AMMECR1 domain-containing protein [Candidatus Elarobacter sp.]
MTSDADRALLLQLARDAIAAHVGAAPPPAPSLADVCARLGGAFVSLHNRGDLRGCIGHIEANEPLARVVSRCAVAACSTDPRFPPVTASELP